MRNLYGYDDLIEKFINHQISISEFERVYLDKFSNEAIRLGDELFERLDWLFAEVDCYTDLPLEPGENPDFHVTEQQLRESAAKVLKEIRVLP